MHRLHIAILPMNYFFSLRLRFLLLVTASLLFITCAKEYSYEGGPVTPGSSSGTAKYTLVGAGGTCIGSTINGKYYAGVALDTSNTIVLQVDVTVAGTYSLTTGSSDGFTFSGSGTFITTGRQTIVLTGSGTPGATGSVSFSTPANSICSFIVTVTDAPPAVATFSLVGAPNNCETAILNGNYVAGTALTAANTVSVKVDVTALGAYTLSTDTIDGISFSTSGTFTTVGKQIVTLIGTGTPQQPRYLVFTPLSGSSGCTFPLTINNPEPVATYVLESGPGVNSPTTCISTVSGNYLMNTPMDNSNTVKIRTFATALGHYTVATDTLNGVSFYYSGMFTSLGINYVLLMGSGKPVAKGTFTYTPQIVGPHPIGGQYCSFDIVVN